ncbi:MAG TPA: NAD-dependent epimerase/dehydratase family protein [Salinivirgaceae bacterium]|nr:NAD-dependent epimerase/dehydratase family protein [Salinivirgaceae bacterium]
MKLLITGAKGFVGKNLVAQLNNIKSGKATFYGDIKINEIYEFDIDNSMEDLDNYCKNADFVFNLAGVNRPKEQSEFMEGNFGFASTLLDTLKKHKNTCPVMLSSSIQATLEGRYAGSEYGKSKKAGEELFQKYAQETGATVYIYRFPNLFGKWCRPNYNSVVATFCHNIANDLPIQVNDRNTELNLVYIDDVVNSLIELLKTHQPPFTNHHSPSTIHHPPFTNHHSPFQEVHPTHKVTLGEIVDLLNSFNEQPKTLVIPEIPHNSFAKKLYSTYLSYLPKEKVAFPLKMNIDNRGSFTELLKSKNCGQVSINISKPGITKGQHWHNSKWEFFMVVSGKGLIQMRKVVPDHQSPITNHHPPTTNHHSPSTTHQDILEFYVSGEKIEAVHMLPGYTHNIINLSDTEDLVTVMWANEPFDPNYPDTYFDPVK